MLLLAACVAEEPIGPDAGEQEPIEEYDLCITCREPFMLPGEQVEVLVAVEDFREYRLETSCEGVPCEVEFEPNSGDIWTGSRHIRFRGLGEGDARISYTVIDVETGTRFDHRLPTQRFREPDTLTAHCMRREQASGWLEPCEPGPQIGARSVHLAYLVHAGDALRPMMPDFVTSNGPIFEYSWDDLIRLVGDVQPSWAYNAKWPPEPGTVTATATWRELEVTASFTVE